MVQSHLKLCSRILPVVVVDDAEKALPLAEALLDGGTPAVEITLRSDAALAAIERIACQMPQMLVGAGTVLNIDQAQRAIDAGAQFGMAPGFDRSVVSFFQDRSIPFVPGVMTPTEIQLAVNHGCTQLKFFPAETMGGVQAIKSISAPFRYHGIRFCATGGINQHNFTDYLQMPGVFAVGGSWLATEDQMMRSDWQAITLQVKQAVSAAQALGL